MSIDYEHLEHQGILLDTLSDPASGLRIQVRREGAELVSLAVRRGDGWEGFLYRDGDVRRAASGWNNHATLMGYYVHRLKGERTLYRGAEIRGGTHSLLRHKVFPAPTVEGASLVYRLNPEQVHPEEYPLKIAFSLRYALTERGVQVTFRFDNKELNSSAHVSFGLHPGFAISSWENARLLLPKGKYVRHLAPGNFLSGETIAFDFSGGPMPFDPSELPGGCLLELQRADSPVVTLEDSKLGRRTCIDLASAPYLTLWSDGGAFICVEPCWGLPDHHQQRPFEQKLGIQQIQPGATLERCFRIGPGFL